MAVDLADLDPAAGTVAVVGKGKTEAVRLTLPRPTRAALAGRIDSREIDPVRCPLRSRGRSADW